MQRRDLMKFMTAAGALNAGAVWSARELWANPTPQEMNARRGLPALKITNVKAILFAATRIRLVVVKVETSEPGLYGIGCATFTQRAKAVVTAVDEFLRPFLIGKDPDHIEDIWQAMYVSSYWRNGPVLYNAMSGVDQALWDIKGKRANMPVYMLLGGKTRMAADCYGHASGDSFEAVEDSARSYIERGFRHVRIQVGIKGMANYGAGRGSTAATSDASLPGPPVGPPKEGMYEPGPYVRTIPKLFAHMRNKLGEEIELLHDVHERVNPDQGVYLCKELEQYRPFFIEDPFSPEQIGYFKLVRQQCATAIAMGELFNSPHEFVGLITDRLIDYIRVHISQIGGLSPARKLAALCEFFGVRTAWHGPGDVSPVGHCANIALDLASYNFGIQEASYFNEQTQEVMPGCPVVKDGYFWANEAPGWGMDINEQAAAKYSADKLPQPFDMHWGNTRRRDGSIVRP
jgi:mannonate dehydratase